MTINEMKETISKTLGEIQNMSFKLYMEVKAVQNKYIHENGYTREYISTNARKAEVETHIQGLIVAMKEVMGA